MHEVKVPMVVHKTRIGYEAFVDGHSISHGKTPHEAEIRGLKAINEALRHHEWLEAQKAAEREKMAAQEKWLKHLSKKKNVKRVSVTYFDEKYAVYEAMRRKENRNAT